MAKYPEYIAKTDRPVTSARIVSDLAALSVEQGDTLLVHSSLSAIGWVPGGPVSVIQALKEAVGISGTIVMPAFSSDLSEPAVWENPPVPEAWHEIIRSETPAFDPAIKPTRGLGQVAENFRTWPDVIRSHHPQLSFCALGEYAQMILKDQPLQAGLGTPSPLSKLYDLNAKVLLLGASYSSCTCFHLAEHSLPNMPTTEEGAPILKDGARAWVTFETLDYDSDDFDACGTEFERTNEVTVGPVGAGNSRLFSLRSAVDFGKTWLATNRA